MESLSVNSEGSTRGTADFPHRIHKLRWIGHHDEAESLLKNRSRQDLAGYSWPVEVETD
jgi:hypothetical protein